MIQRYRAFYEGKMYGVKAVIWTSRGLYVTLDEGNKLVGVYMVQPSCNPQGCLM